MIELAMEAAVFTLLLCSLVRRRWHWIERLVPIFFVLLIPVMMGLNRPNPDWVRLIAVAVP